MNEEYYIGQIFEETYPSAVATWCNRNNARIVEIDPITKEVEETYVEIVPTEQEQVIPAEYDENGEVVVEEHTETIVVDVPEERTRTVEKTFRRYEIQAIPEPTEEEIKQARIAELKAQLNSTDYKIIKCSENSLAGIELPYDIAELHAQRQALRDEINELEQ